MSMLVNCPKCGFSQPKDRYCASCGVDMETYRPAKVPLWKKILKSPVLHIVLIVVLVLVSILYVRQKQKEELLARVQYLKGGPLLVEKSQQGADIQVGASAETQAQIAQGSAPAPANGAAISASESAIGADAGPSPSASANTNPVPVAANARSATPGNPASIDATAATAKFPTKVTAIYAEVDVATLNSWMDEARASNALRSFDEVLMGPIPKMATKMRSGGIKILQRVEQPLEAMAIPVEWFTGTHRGTDPENEIGLFASLLIGDSKDGLTRGEIEVQRAFRDPADATKSIERISYGGNFELPAGSGFFMRGLLPRKFATELDEQAHPDPFLSILKSPAFREGQTEFTLILEFDTTSP